jgi:hypothetical protein
VINGWASILPLRFSLCQPPIVPAKPRQRRALRLLAGSPLGVTEAIMLAHGFTIDLLVDLVHEGLATATPETVHAGKRAIEVVRVRITDAGRLALAG